MIPFVSLNGKFFELIKSEIPTMINPAQHVIIPSHLNFEIVLFKNVTDKKLVKIIIDPSKEKI